MNGEPLLDLCYEEDSKAEVDMNMVMTSVGEFVELQATGEQNSFSDAQLGSLITLGRAGVRQLIECNATFWRPVNLYCATTNPGKLQEFQLAAEVFGGGELTVSRCRIWPRCRSAWRRRHVRGECGQEGHVLRPHTDGSVFVDDSGLAVDSVEGRAGHVLRALCR